VGWCLEASDPRAYVEVAFKKLLLIIIVHLIYIAFLGTQSRFTHNKII